MARNGKGKQKKDKKGGGKKGKKKTLASSADKYDLYQQSVQNPGFEVSLLKKMYKDAVGRNPEVLREDFCGTAAICCEWVKGEKSRRAWGVDLDPEPLGWGSEKNLSALKPGEIERVALVKGDVRDAITPEADVIAAMNFSYFCFKTRDELRAYFKAAYDNLKSEGILACDMFGGYEVHEDDRLEETEYDDFTYVWDQHKFDPITHDYTFYIHFELPDGSKLKKAFEYNWRLWSIPEVRELLVEAGFKRADVYWEGTDQKTGEGNGQYRKREKAEADAAWLAYIVGVK